MTAQARSRAPPVCPTALEGVKVLDISNLLVAPMSTMYLADFGADLIKVERTGG